MSDTHEYFLPGGDGHWDDIEIPGTLVDAQERIRVLQAALRFYSNGRSYDSVRECDDIPSYSELMNDKGLVARIGRVATRHEQFAEWLAWARKQDRRW